MSTKTIRTSAKPGSTPSDGSCYYTGLASLSNPTDGGKPGIVVFDAVIYVGSDCEKSNNPSPYINGKLSWYNRLKVDFYEEGTLFNVTCSLAFYGRNMVTSALDTSSEDLHFCGDIENLLPIGTVENTTAPEDESGNPEDFDCGHFSIDTAQWGMLFVTGQAVKCDRTNGVFTLNLIIYLGGMPKVENVPKTHITTATVICYFPSNSPRWRGQSGPPTPYEGRSVFVMGRLAGFELGPAKNGWAARPNKFFLEIHNITFVVGSLNSPTASSITTVPNTLDSPTTTIAKKNAASAAARKTVKKGTGPAAGTTPDGQLAEPSRKANTTKSTTKAPGKSKSSQARSTRSQTEPVDDMSEDAPLSAKAKGKRRQTEPEVLDIEGDVEGAEEDVMEINDDADYVPAPAPKRAKLRL